MIRSCTSFIKIDNWGNSILFNECSGRHLMFGRETQLPVDIMFGPPPTDVTSPNEHATQLQISLRQALQGYVTIWQLYTIVRNSTMTNTSMVSQFNLVISSGCSPQQFHHDNLTKFIVPGQGRTRSSRKC